MIASIVAIISIQYGAQPTLPTYVVYNIASAWLASTRNRIHITILLHIEGQDNVSTLKLLAQVTASPASQLVLRHS